MSEVETNHSNGKHSLDHDEDIDHVASVKAKLLKAENGHAVATANGPNGVVKSNGIKTSELVETTKSSEADNSEDTSTCGATTGGDSALITNKYETNSDDVGECDDECDEEVGNGHDNNHNEEEEEADEEREVVDNEESSGLIGNHTNNNSSSGNTPRIINEESESNGVSNGEQINLSRRGVVAPVGGRSKLTVENSTSNYGDEDENDVDGDDEDEDEVDDEEDEDDDEDEDGGEEEGENNAGEEEETNE